jgi:hypothetical protein
MVVKHDADAVIRTRCDAVPDEVVSCSRDQGTRKLPGQQLSQSPSVAQVTWLRASPQRPKLTRSSR